MKNPNYNLESILLDISLIEKVYNILYLFLLELIINLIIVNTKIIVKWKNKIVNRWY